MKHDLLDIVATQEAAVSTEFSCREQLKRPNIESHTTELYTEMLEEAIECHSTPIPLDQCKLPQLVLVRICKKYQQDPQYKQRFGEAISRHFVLLGELAQAPNHVIVISTADSKIYSGYHSDIFEIVPTQEC